MPPYVSEKPPADASGFFGASDLTRTGDLLITSEMHYRLCYTSKPSYYSGFYWKSQLVFYMSSSRPTGQ